MSKGALTLRTCPLNLIRIVCHKCGRSGQYRRATLIDRFGPEMALPELRHQLAQCPRRHVMSDPCQVIFPDLVGR
jgi:hypothetical protein